MAYNVIRDFCGDPGTDYAMSDPFWILAVYRLAEPVTYLRFTMKSFSSNPSDGVKLRGGPLIITDDCTALQISSNKSSYVMNLSASLLGSGLNYISEIFPGDYVMAWMFTNRSDYERVLKNIPTSDNINNFDDGFKFYGRVQSLRKHIAQAPGGTRQTRFQLNCVGFNEFDAQIFYDPHLAARIDKMGALFAQLDVSVNSLISDNQKGINVNKAIPTFVDLILGKGIPVNDKLKTTGTAIQAVTGASPDYAYIIPAKIGEKLGIGHDTGGHLKYSDILEKVVGLQQYDSSDQEAKVEGDDIRKNAQAKAKQFIPRSLNEMLGAFQPASPQLTNKPVWTILQQYLNPAANEMYTCMRVNQDGRVMPTLVVRQLPFTSEMFDERRAPEDAPADAAENLEATKFLNLPRWVIDPVLVKAADIGRSDTMRFNFVHVYGENGQPHGDMTAQLVRNPPFRDEMDIARSGLRPYMTTVPCALSEVVKGGPGKWMALLSDIVMGQHMTLTGVLQTFGIQAPICIGDNIEWEGAVFHIEAISHVATISPDGQKDFSTTLNLTHGLHDTNKDPNPDLSGLQNDLQIYAAVNLSDFTGKDPGVTPDIISTDKERTGVRDVEPGTSLADARKRAKEEDNAKKNATKGDFNTGGGGFA